MTNSKSPDWWHFSDSVWTRLNTTLSALNRDYAVLCSDKNNWLPVGGGVTNYSYQLNLNELELFIQIVDHTKIVRLPDQVFIPTAQTLSSNQKLNQWLVKCFLDSEELRIFEWLEAAPTTADHFNSSMFIDKLCMFLSVLHSDISTLPMLDINKHLENYFHLAVKKNPEQKSLLKEKYSTATKLTRQFKASKTCHNDLSPGNILIDKNLFVVDWEYCCISDPLFDLAGICHNFQLNETQEQKLLSSYTRHLSSYFHEDKFYEMKLLYELVCDLWSAHP